MSSALPLDLRAGFGRTQFLFLLGILALLVIVGIGPLLLYLKHAHLNRSIENSRTLSTLLSQYATDNEGVYPVGQGTNAVGKSEGIARNFLANNYIPDARIFVLGTATKYTGTSTDFADFSAENIDWDFTAGADTSTGITSTASDLLPVVYSTGETIAYSPGFDLTISDRGPFEKKGVIVAYKGGNAAFITANDSGICLSFISHDFKDTGTYTQIKP